VRAPLTFESLASAFFIALAVAAFATQASTHRRAQVALLSAFIATGVIAASQATEAIRGWLGHAYLVAAYWIPALLIPSSDPPGRFESWLVRSDRWCRIFAISPPAWAASTLELSYLLCYVLVPVAFVLVWTGGTIADVDRFWTAVLLSGFLCYASLPWLVSRPPRTLNAAAVESAGVHGVNEFVLKRVSHGLNTFPSGHVAVSLAAALEVMPISQPAGIVLLVIASAIAAGAVLGRYHYALDVLVGAILGITISLFV
jgi:membrane-associated phospholipid phosphatase